MDQRKTGIESPILITGCARSGTSLTAGIVGICGAWGGKTAGATLNNKRGMYENTEIRNVVVKPFLKSIKCDPLGQNPLPGQEHLHKIINYSFVLKKDVFEIIKRQGYSSGLWYYKGAKMTLMWQAWHISFPNAFWIIVRRKDEDIIHSCLKTGFMRAYQNPAGWQSWVNVHKDNFFKMKTSGLNVFEIWPQEMISGDFSKMKSMIKKIGLKWESKEIHDFVSPALWSERRKQNDSESNQR